MICTTFTNILSHQRNQIRRYSSKTVNANMPWEKVHESTQFLNIHVRKKRVLLSSTFKKKFYLPATYSWITGDHARNRRRCNFSWRDQILAIMRSIGKGRLYTCTKHPNHQISLARLMMLVCSIKKKKKTKPSGDITITIEDALSSLSQLCFCIIQFFNSNQH